MLHRQTHRITAIAVRETSPRSRVGINYIAWKMGRDRDSDDGSVMAASEKWLVNRIRQLVAKAGFPPPLAPHMRCGEVREGPAAVHKLAVWDKLDVDRWFERPTLPPAAFGVPANDTASAWAERLDARAAQL